VCACLQLCLQGISILQQGQAMLSAVQKELNQTAGELATLRGQHNSQTTQLRAAQVRGGISGVHTVLPRLHHKSACALDRPGPAPTLCCLCCCRMCCILRAQNDLAAAERARVAAVAAQEAAEWRAVATSMECL
jgi:hypothetical protein